MRSSVSAKRCPQCHRVTSLNSPGCLGCGHVFRTRFAAPPDAPNASQEKEDGEGQSGPVRPAASLLPLSSVPSGRPPARFSSALVFSAAALLLGGAAWWNAVHRSPATMPPHSAPPPPAGPIYSPLPADGLYARISLGMPLYEVTQAAGGLGRVIRSDDPHLLILRYDPPAGNGSPRTVRVVLERPNPAGNDYRVRSIALYHGAALVRRRQETD